MGKVLLEYQAREPLVLLENAGKSHKKVTFGWALKDKWLCYVESWKLELVFKK